MSSKIIKITDTTLRDAHQSLFATRFNNETISELAPLLDGAGYDVLEVWGGATFDSCIRYLNEDPWDRLKMINRLTPNTKLSMLLRGANLVGYKHYSTEIIQDFITVSADFGIDVFRVFDALNDINNLKDVAKAVKNTGKHLQLTLCYSVGESGKLEASKNEIYTLDYYLNLANKFVEMGADSLCIKDMAGLLSPYDASLLVSELKKIVDIPLQLHNHYTSGLASMTQIKAIESGVDGVDTCVSTVSQRTSQPAIEPLSKTFDSLNSNYKVNINMKIINKIAEKLENEVPKYSQFNVATKFSTVDADVLSHQIPGGMISNLASQLKDNNNLSKLPEVLLEIPRVRKDLGMPPLVTPISQMVGAQSVNNVLSGRYSNLSQQMIEYLSGGYGTPPGKINTKIFGDKTKNKKVKNKIQSLDDYAKEIKNLTNYKPDIITYAMFEEVGRKFLESKSIIHDKTEESSIEIESNSNDSKQIKNNTIDLTLNFEGKEYNVSAELEGNNVITNINDISKSKKSNDKNNSNVNLKSNENSVSILSPISGTILKYLVKKGDKISKDQPLVNIESMKMENTIKSDKEGIVKQINFKIGDTINSKDPIINLS